MSNFKIVVPKFILPQLNETCRKGSSGRIGIVGGSKNYTGAPFYAAFTSLRCGGDLSYVICCKSAASSIKSYSPELIVVPILDDEENFENDISILLAKLHSLVIGPGLGYDNFKNVTKIINLARQKEIPLTIDAESIALVGENPDLIKGYRKTILTPNVREFNNLCEKLNLKSLNLNQSVNEEEIKDCVLKVSQKLNGVTVVRKGQFDYISNSDISFQNTLIGSGRRCGGQGDVLVGIIGIFHYWMYKFGNYNQEKLYEATIHAAHAGCYLTRRINHLTFIDLGRSMLTTDMLNYIGKAFKSLGLI